MSSVVGDADLSPFFYVHRVSQRVTEAASALIVGLPLNHRAAMPAQEPNGQARRGPLVFGPSGVRHPT
jgi:hypothetical protein